MTPSLVYGNSDQWKKGRGVLYDRSHNPQTGTVQTCERTVTQTITQTHSHTTNHSDTDTSVPAEDCQWLSKTVHPLLTNQQNQQEMKTAALVWLSASPPCNYALWGVGRHMLAHKQWPLPQIVWAQGNFDKWFTFTCPHSVMSTEAYFFNNTWAPRRPPQLNHVISPKHGENECVYHIIVGLSCCLPVWVHCRLLRLGCF